MFDDEQAPLEDWVVPGMSRPPTPPEPLPPPVTALQEAVEGLRQWQPARLDASASLRAAEAVLVAEQALLAVRLRVLADVEARQLHRLAQARSTGSWLRQQGLDVPAAQVMLARRLPGLPLLADEVASGALSVPAAQQVQAALAELRPLVDRPDGLIDGQPAEQVLAGVLRDGVRTLVCEARGGYADDDPELLALVARLEEVADGPHGELARLEAGFLLLARHVDPVVLGPALRTLVDAVLPQQLAERAERGRRLRDVSLLRKADGTGFRLRGDVSLTCGERLQTALQAEVVRDPDRGLDTQASAQLREQGLDPYAPEVELSSCTRPRRRGERLHDALEALLVRCLAAGLGGTHDKTPVQVVVTVPAAALDEQPGALPARGRSGASLPAALVRRLACGSALSRFVLTLGGRVLQESHSERTLTAAERRALLVQTGGVCQAAGCSRSARDPGVVLHPHHATPYAETGTTCLADTVLLCAASHGDVHDGGLVITLKDGRRLGPHGWVT